MMRDMFGFVRASGSMERERDRSGFFKDAPASQPYMMASGKRKCPCTGCDGFLADGWRCAMCCRENEKQGSRSAFQNACGCGA